MMAIDWAKRGYKIVGSFFNGYAASWSAVFGVSYYQQWQIDFFTLFLFPCIGGLGMTWPQIGKVFTELGSTR